MALPKGMFSGRQDFAAFFTVETVLGRHHQPRRVGSKADVAVAACAANMAAERGIVSATVRDLTYIVLQRLLFVSTH